MHQQSLFGYLAERFTASPENLATEALNYILARSPVARAAFIRFVSEAGVQIQNDLLFKTQAAETDKAIPDLMGSDANGQPVILVEAKFWAGLTDNQPVTYLQRFSRDAYGVLLFVAPALRFATLWPELLRRCQEGGLQVEIQRDISQEFKVAAVNTKVRLALVSWRALLAYLVRSLEAAGQTDIVSDLQQLQGLCDRMDGQAFLPLRSEELSGDSGKRIIQFCSLVDDVTAHFLAEGIASVKGLKATSAAGIYGRYVLLKEYGCFLHFNATFWGTLRSTPFWLRVKDKNWKASAFVRQALSKLELEEPSRLIIVNGNFLVPLYAPIAKEQSQVLESLTAQVREVIDLLIAHEKKEAVEPLENPPTAY